MPCLTAPRRAFLSAVPAAPWRSDAPAAAVAAASQPVQVVVEPALDPYFERLAGVHAKEHRDLVEACRPRAPLEHLARPPDAARGTMTGRERLAVLRRTLDAFGLVRSKNQREFHREMIKAVLPHIFKDDLDENLDDLLREYECEQFKSEVMIITPRRWGKTYSVAMFVVACAAAIGNLEQAIFSTGRRASKKLLDLIFKLLRKVPDLRNSVIVRNVETIWIRGPEGDDDIRKIYSYPSKASRAAKQVRARTRGNDTKKR